jgi:hypothetical protein
LYLSSCIADFYVRASANVMICIAEASSGSLAREELIDTHSNGPDHALGTIDHHFTYTSAQKKEPNALCIRRLLHMSPPNELASATCMRRTVERKQGRVKLPQSNQMINTRETARKQASERAAS